jgi:predicted RNA-binding protein YlqC (UPF0109 family)
MKKLLESLVKAIVENSKDVVVEERKENGWLTLALRVHPDDLKIVIGKGGQTIKALRELVKIKAIRKNLKVNLEIIEEAQKAKGSSRPLGTIEKPPSETTSL